MPPPKLAPPADPLIGRTIDGRFKIEKLLGEGGMGRVYLAEQTSIGRPVALKLLSPGLGSDERLNDRFRNEASLASRLNHPSTVIIYDFGVTSDGLLFIAMELLEGKSLKDELDLCPQMEWRRTAAIAKQICGSLQDAHDKAIIHRDLKPENIMILQRNLEKDLVKVLDFGVAKILVDNDWKAKRGITAPNEIFGTPEYMSPEQARGDDMSPSTDIYSLGVILFRMLSGRLPFDAPTPIAVLAKHLGEAPPALGACMGKKTLPASFEALVMECLSKQTAGRPKSMDEMRVRLDALLSAGETPLPTILPVNDVLPTEVSVGGGNKADDVVRILASPPLTPDTSDEKVESGSQAASEQEFRRFTLIEPNPQKSAREQTLEKLLSRIKSRRDFPAISRNISELNSKVGMVKTSASQLANVILKDTSLTTRLIKLANSPFYGNTRGRITMVSRAVVLMGFEAVREAALGLLLFDHLQSADPTRASELQDAGIFALMSGIIAKENAWRMNGINKEEAFICAMFHNLGRQGAIFYLPDEMNEIRALVESGKSEDKAVQEIIGVTFDDLGQELAKQWDFPDQIRNTMVKLSGGQLEKPKNKEEKLRHMAGFATEMTRLASLGDPVNRKAAFAAFMTRFDESIKISEEEISDVVTDSLAKMEDYAKHMNLRPAESKLVKEIHRTMGTIRDVKEEAPASKSQMSHSGRILRAPDMTDDEYAALIREAVAEETARKEQILKDGIEEVTASMKGRFDLNTVMLAVLESMYRALGFHRVFFCLYDVRTKTLRARFGFGKEIDELLPDFHFSPKGGRDVFVTAMSSGEDIAVMNTSDKKYFGQIPAWYKSLVDSPMFCLYPIRIQQFPAAIFYGDMEVADTIIEPVLLEQMSLLREKAAQAIAAIDKDRSRRG